MNFAQIVLKLGGIIRPLIIPAHMNSGLGLMNPSILNHNGKLVVILRAVNYTFYHSEKKIFQHPYGPLTYIHPENDVKLRTWNYYLELNDDYEITRINKIDTSDFPDKQLWEFIGLEDARIFEWEGKMYISGVRRDLDTKGTGRMELCEIDIRDDEVKQISQVRIEPPNNPNSYCEKNWMPVLDKPYHYVKWSNPTEVVKVNPETGTSETVFLEETCRIGKDTRGGSQLIPWRNYYVAITHDVSLFKSETGRKDAIYTHRFLFWDRNFNLIKWTDPFSIMGGHVEFCIGLARKDNDFLMTFGFQDNAAYILKFPEKILEDLLVNYPSDEIDRNVVKNNLQKLDDSGKDLHRVYLPKRLREFDWGHAADNEWFRKTVEKEIFIDDVYQKFFKVEEGDIVFDVGSSVGPFTHFIKEQKPEKIYCFEPHPVLYKDLVSNVLDENVICTNKAIGSIDGSFDTHGLFNAEINETCSDENLRTVPSVKFSTFIKENNIDRIDFLKSDCEGGEYDIFTDENMDWIRKNVRKIAGEWHLSTPEQKAKFRKFRDTYLKEFPKHEIYSIDYVDIKWSLWDDRFIERYALINLYIDNQEQPNEETFNLNDSFNWGIFQTNSWNLDCLKEEFDKDNYQKHFKVEKGDVVVDIGASVGPFSYSALKNDPKAVICLEPHPELYKTLDKNVGDDERVTTLNCGISSRDGEVIFDGLYNDDLSTEYRGDDLWKKKSAGKGITFNTLIEKFNLEKIDFLKIDCEGGEYDVFTDENYDWIKKNVRKIAGEWHFGTPELKQKFIKFRDKYLKNFDNYKVYFVDYHSNFSDLTESVWDNETIQRTGWLNIYIDNTKQKPRDFWKNSIAPTMEFTTSIDIKNGCVVDCVFCPQRTLQESYTGNKFLSIDDFKTCVNKIPKEVRITFAGFTEPWLNPECTDMLLYAHERGHPISVFTTGIGMKLDDIERIKHIPFAGQPNGGFTLHLPDQDKKAKHPITDRYVKVIERFGELRNEIQNFNVMSMGEIDSSVKHVFSKSHIPEMWSRAGNLLHESILKPELLNRKNEYKSVYHGEKPRTCGCMEKMYHNVMLPNGDVSLCCMDYGLEHIIGNLLEQDYEDVIPDNNACFNLCRFCENGVKPE